MNILAIDVGNSRVSAAACRNGILHAVAHLPADADDAVLTAALGEAARALGAEPPPRVVVCSVNPPVADRVAASAAALVDRPALFIGRDIELPLAMDVDSPQKVGVDRVVAAAAAFEQVGGPVVVVSLGTALTINAVDAEGRFLGGTISPGLGLSARMLHEGTFALPQIEAARPPGPFGKNTRQAIEAGLFYMAGGVIREVVERMAEALGTWPYLVLTGGDAERIASAYEFVDSVVPNLCLLGVNLAYRRHVEQTGKR